MDSELNAGSGGVFIVTVDGKVTYDKKETGQFPTKGEVTQIITSST